ncbi:5-carboxymethyl-2-hydroxymuconate isomerase [Herbaspirillum seropedicae]|uniref:5-carboxymethyl-2-hydroxymuconate isomerase n=1 Tax=Herbaspirillum seropedicae TaxID=964 RepID=UPI00285A71F7|nr:5-carboxymethyl-2-hydroxymuconate isomerase [Herbaspirillum seropedicae]MDR6397492.1 5-carboxymethyl-2-hydroxymuconate isomerase [Herbaspirillum seropedicae]
MPHLVILHSGNLAEIADMSSLCRKLADAMLAIRDEEGKQVFPTGGTRVLAYPAPAFAIADGSGDFAFAYFSLRMGRGRSESTRLHIGSALTAVLNAEFSPVLEKHRIGLTFQIDEGPEVFDAKIGNLHELFRKP